MFRSDIAYALNLNTEPQSMGIAYIMHQATPPSRAIAEELLGRAEKKCCLINVTDMKKPMSFERYTASELALNLPTVVSSGGRE